MNEIGENNEYRVLRLRAEYLRERYAEETEIYMALVSELRAEVSRLEEKLSAMVRKRQDLMKQQPYCWEKLLENEDEVARRREELQRELEVYRDEIADCEELWKIRKEAA